MVRILSEKEDRDAGLDKREEWLSGKCFHPDSFGHCGRVKCGLWILLPSGVGVVSTPSHSLGNSHETLMLHFSNGWTGVSRWFSSPCLAPRDQCTNSPRQFSNQQWDAQNRREQKVLMALRLSLSALKASLHGRKSVSPWEPTEWATTTMIGTELGKSYIPMLQPLK